MAFKPTYHERNLANLQKLGDKTKALAMKWYNYLIAKGIDVLIYETIRTKEKQAENVRKGVSQTMRSYHLVGQALDFVPIVNGKTDWNAYDNPKIQQAIAYAKVLGFTWGGDWKTFKDKPHLQYDKIPYGADTFTGKVASKSYLEKGDKGQAVKELQSKLVKVGYKLAVDGIFGAKTEQAVRDFQAKNGLIVDGLAGKNTMAKLDEKVKAAAVKPAPVAKKEGVISGDVWTHSKPDFAESTRVKVLKKGEKVSIFGEAGDLYKIGANLYVSKKYVIPVVKPVAKTGVATGDVWLHSKADFSKATRTEVLKKGESVGVYGEVNGMYKIRKGGKTHYVSKKYLTVK